MLDLGIVLTYFVVVMLFALRGRLRGAATVEQYFLSSRNLRWPSIAVSTIATNVQGYQFLGMMGSAYLYGLAQANLEINAMQGLLLAAFVFVPLYLRDRVVTVTQFIQKRMGRNVGLAYSGANLLLLGTVGLGAALFWGAYAADLVFAEQLRWIHPDRFVRTSVLVVALGVFSAIYTYLGGLAAVVKTDLIQFVILVAGGAVILFTSIRALGGWSQLYARTPDLMHLHLPADHPTLPWVAFGGWFLLNINYWCANQSVVQRSLAAQNLRQAQIGLMVGGVMKYFMAVLIIVPGIALVGILGPEALADDPDQTFPYLVREFLAPGWRGLILCALFASLMSTVDSTFNSLATLFSIDLYKGVFRPDATEADTVRTGRRTILVTLLTGTLTGIALLYAKLGDSQVAFTHTLNELRYYVNVSIVVLICAAGLLWSPKQGRAIAGFATAALVYLLLDQWTAWNYFVRAMWAILGGFLVVALGERWRAGRQIITVADRDLRIWAWMCVASLVVLHFLFH